MEWNASGWLVVVDGPPSAGMGLCGSSVLEFKRKGVLTLIFYALRLAHTPVKNWEGGCWRNQQGMLKTEQETKYLQ